MRILITPKGTQLVTEIEEMALTTKSMLSQTNPRQRNFTSSHYNPHHTTIQKVTHPNRFKSTKSTSIPINQSSSNNTVSTSSSKRSRSRSRSRHRKEDEYHHSNHSSHRDHHRHHSHHSSHH